MKDKTGIFKSRYVKSAAIALLITTAVIVAVTSFVSRESLKTPKGIEKSITDFAEVVIPFGKYEQVRVLDGGRGVLAVKEKDGFVKLVDFEQNQLLDLKPFISIGACEGRYMTLLSDKGWSALNYEDALKGGKIRQTDFNEINIRREGGYYIGKKYHKGTTDLSGCQVMDYEGNVIYKSSYDLAMASRDGYVIAYPKNSPEKIVELKSGKEVFVMGEDEKYSFDSDELWIIEKDDSSRFLDKNFRPALGGLEIKVSGISDDGRYMIVRVEENGTAFSGIMNSDGKIIFTEKERKEAGKDRSYREIIGNTVVAERWDGEKFALSYIDISESEREGKPVSRNIGRGTGDFCMMDFEDGVAVVNREKDLSGQSILLPTFNYVMSTIWYGSNAGTGWMEKFDWGFVDEDGKRICDLIFSGAFPTDNRYAAVAVSDMWGGIKFK